VSGEGDTFEVLNVKIRVTDVFAEAAPDPA
jgi:hypothetical protein